MELFRSSCVPKLYMLYEILLVGIGQILRYLSGLRNFVSLKLGDVRIFDGADDDRHIHFFTVGSRRRNVEMFVLGIPESSITLKY